MAKEGQRPRPRGKRMLADADPKTTAKGES